MQKKVRVHGPSQLLRMVREHDGMQHLIGAILWKHHVVGPAAARPIATNRVSEAKQHGIPLPR